MADPYAQNPSPSKYLMVPWVKTTPPDWIAALKQQNLPSVASLFTSVRDSQVHESVAQAWSASHEAARAFLMAWPELDGYYPWAALDPLATNASMQLSFAYLQLGHWKIGMNEVMLTPLEDLQLSEKESRALMESIKPLLDASDQNLMYCSENRWLAQGDMFRQVKTASISRVKNQSVQYWQDTSIQAQQARRLLSEIQMTFYTHAVNEERESKGLLPINSVWMSGAGSLYDVPSLAALEPQAQERLINTWRHFPIETFDCFERLGTEPDLEQWLSAWKQFDEQLHHRPSNAPTHIILGGETSWTLLELGEKNKWQKALAFLKKKHWTQLILEK